jgi:hypothetical protein
LVRIKIKQKFFAEKAWKYLHVRISSYKDLPKQNVCNCCTVSATLLQINPTNCTCTSPVALPHKASSRYANSSYVTCAAL